MKEFQDVAELEADIRERIAGHECALIGVDGAYGSGKSTLARRLAKPLGAITVKIDDFTKQNGEPYRKQLRYEDIKRAIADARAQGKSVIVEGVCLLHVLKEIDVTADAIVYVKRLGEHGIWHDEDTCDVNAIDLESAMFKISGSELAREVASYHLEHDPVARAEVLFMRVEQPDRT